MQDDTTKNRSNFCTIQYLKNEVKNHLLQKGNESLFFLNHGRTKIEERDHCFPDSFLRNEVTNLCFLNMAINMDLMSTENVKILRRQIETFPCRENTSCK